jgi:hypothetical protein
MWVLRVERYVFYRKKGYRKTGVLHEQSCFNEARGGGCCDKTTPEFLVESEHLVLKEAGG